MSWRSFEFVSTLDALNHHLPCLSFCSLGLFSRDEETLYERASVRPSVGWLVGPLVAHAFVFFGLLGATNAVYTAPLLVFFYAVPTSISCLDQSVNYFLQTVTAPFKVNLVIVSHDHKYQ